MPCSPFHSLGFVIWPYLLVLHTNSLLLLCVAKLHSRAATTEASSGNLLAKRRRVLEGKWCFSALYISSGERSPELSPLSCVHCAVCVQCNGSSSPNLLNVNLFQLLEEATRVLKFPHAGRRVFTMEGEELMTVDDIEDEMELVITLGEGFKPRINIAALGSSAMI